MPANKVETIDLIKIGKTLMPDRDFPLTRNPQDQVAIIRLEAGIVYPEEEHEWTETILALDGSFTILADGAKHPVSTGQCIRIAPGLRHRWDPQSKAIVLVHFGDPA